MTAEAILVTGGAGYVGSHACQALAAAGYLPVVYDNLSEGHHWAVQWGPLEQGDIRDRARLDQLFRRYRFSAVLHFAARAYVGESVQDPAGYYDNNVVGTLTLLAAMRHHAVTQLVFSSSCATYGLPERLPIGEQQRQAPISPYGTTKLMVEQILADYAAAYGVRSVALRYFNAAGADPAGRIGELHAPETHLIPLAIRSVLDPDFQLQLFGDDYPTPDGSAVRDYIHVVDLAAAHVAALRYLAQGGTSVALNLGTGLGVSVREVVAAVERISGRPAKVATAPRRPGDPPELYADPSRAQALLQWRAERSSIDAIITDAWAWQSGERLRQLTAPGAPALEPWSALPLSAPLAGPRRRICIVSTEFNGVYRNGGIGTAHTSLGLALAAAGHPVTFLYTRGSECESATIDHWIGHYRQLGVELVPLPPGEGGPGQPGYLVRAQAVYRWLAEHDRFDTIHFQEHGGIGYYALAAKRCGVAFAHTSLVVGCHSSSLWIRECNDELLDQPALLDLDFMERESLRLADVGWSPSRYLARWMVAAGWQLPAAFYIQPYIVPPAARTAPASVEEEGARPVSELVFFGRLETRKGLELFCDALDRLARRPAAAALRITFLGRHAQVRGQASGPYLARRGGPWPWSWQVIADYDQPQAMAYLRQPGRVAVMASPADNSPNTVYECLAAGIPFIACHSGGIPELIAPQQVATTCFPFDAAALAERLEQLAQEGLAPAQPAIRFAANEAAWVEWHQQPAAPLPPAPPSQALAVVILWEPGDGLPRLLADLRPPTGPQPLLLLVAPPDVALPPVAAAVARCAPQVLHQQLPAAPLLLLLGSETELAEDALPRLANAMVQSQADLLLLTTTDPDSAEPQLLLGAAPASGLRTPLWGDPHALCLRRETLLARPLTQPPEQWLAEMVLSGQRRLELLPLPLLRRPRRPQSPPGHSAAQAQLAPYNAQLPLPLQPLLRLLHGMLNSAPRHDGVAGLLVERARQAQFDAATLYGAGEFFERLLPQLVAAGIRINAVVDRKAAAGEYRVAGYTVTTLERAVAAGERQFIVASAAFVKEIEAAILAQCPAARVIAL